MGFINTVMIVKTNELRNKFGATQFEVKEYSRDDFIDPTFSNNLDDIGATFTFRAIDKFPWNTLQKYDVIEFYTAETDTKITDTKLLVRDEFKRFTGYIDTANPSETKNSKDILFECFSTFVLANEFPAFIETTTGQNVLDMLLLHMAHAGLVGTNLPEDITSTGNIENPEDGIIPVSKITIDQNLLIQSIGISSSGAKTVKILIDELRDKYAYKIFQLGDGTIKITTPFYLLQGASSVTSWLIDRTYLDINYNDILKNVEAVVVLGANNTKGIAVDFAAVQAKGKNQPNYQLFVRRDIFDEQTADQVAKELLLDILRNNIITLTIPVNFDLQIGHTVNIVSDRLTGNEIFTVRSHSWTLSKGSSSGTSTIEVYAHSLTDVPENLVIDKAGIADIEILVPPDKSRDEFVWDNFGNI